MHHTARHADDTRPVAPQVLLSRGVYESPYWSIAFANAVSLLAITSTGRCVDFTFVRTEGQYRTEWRRLEALLDEVDPVTPLSAKDQMVARVASVISETEQRRAGLRLE